MLNGIDYIVAFRSAQLATSTQKWKIPFASETFMGVPKFEMNQMNNITTIIIRNVNVPYCCAFTKNISLIILLSKNYFQSWNDNKGESDHL